MVSEEISRSKLEDLARLPTTESLTERLQKLQAQADSEGANLQTRTQQDLKWTYSRIALAGLRDRIAAARPQGCKCLGLGQYWDGAHTMLCSCPEGEAEKERRQAAKAVERVNRVELRWERAEIPSRFWGFTLDSSFVLRAHPALQKALLSAIARDDPPSASWYFWGDYNVGKTGLAVGYARAWLEACGGTYGLLFRTLPRLLSELRSTYNRKDEEAPTEDVFLERYRNVGLLILDDLGAEQVTGSGWVQDRLYQIIGERHDEERSVVFTSNLNLDEMAAKIGERLTWRILEMCGQEHIIHLVGPNLRAGKQKAREGEAET